MSDMTQTVGGSAFTSLLLLLFIALKLTHQIDWSWGWVLSPLWIPIALVFAVFLIVLVVSVVLTAVKG